MQEDRGRDEDGPSPKKQRVDPNFRKKKRNRTMQSCYPCHQLKRKCDRGRPCSRCVSAGIIGSCIYEVADPDAPRNADESSVLRSRVAELEALVRQLRHSKTSSSPSKIMMESPVEDLFQGLSTPILANDTPIASTSKQPMPTQDNGHFGSMIFSQLNQEGAEICVGVSGAPFVIDAINRRAERAIVPPELAYNKGEDPSTFAWQGDRRIDVAVEQAISFLPSLVGSSDLFSIFASEVDTIWRGWHLPTLETTFFSFVRANKTEQVQRKSDLVLVLSMLSLATFFASHTLEAPSREMLTFLNTASLDMHTAAGREVLVKLYLSAALFFLDQLDLTTTSTLRCLQAELICCLTLSSIGANSFYQRRLVLLVKKCQTVGLHVDPNKSLGGTILEKEERRRLWWTIQSLDCFGSLYIGAPLSSHLSDCDLPQDRSDESLAGPQAPSTAPLLPRNGITSTSYSLYALEISLYAKEAFGLLKGSAWSWGTKHARTPSFEEVRRLAEAIVQWKSHIPPQLIFEVEPSQGGRPSSPSRKPTSALDLNECSTGIVKQSLLLNIQASVLMMIIYRPFIESADGQVAKAEIAEKECINAAHTIIGCMDVLRTLLPNSPVLRCDHLWSYLYSSALCIAYVVLNKGNGESTALLQDLSLAISLLETKADGRPALCQDYRTSLCLVKDLFVLSPHDAMISSPRFREPDGPPPAHLLTQPQPAPDYFQMAAFGQMLQAPRTPHRPRRARAVSNQMP